MLANVTLLQNCIVSSAPYALLKLLHYILNTDRHLMYEFQIKSSLVPVFNCVQMETISSKILLKLYISSF